MQTSDKGLIFPHYLVLGALTESGWPKAAGFLKRKHVVDRRALDNARYLTVRNALGLAAGRPRIAVRVFADCFYYRDWNIDPVQELLDFCGQFFAEMIGARDGATDWERLHRALTAANDQEQLIPWESVGDREFQVRTQFEFCSVLLWALRNPDAVLEGLKSEQRQVATLREQGVDVRWTPPPPDRFFADCEERMMHFQRNARTLENTPTAVIEHPELAAFLKRPIHGVFASTG